MENLLPSRRPTPTMTTMGHEVAQQEIDTYSDNPARCGHNGTDPMMMTSPGLAPIPSPA